MECASLRPFFHPEHTRTSAKIEFELPCNWKFVPENLMDLYRVGVIHHTSIGPMPRPTGKVL